MINRFLVNYLFLLFHLMPKKGYRKAYQYVNKQLNDPVFCLVVHELISFNRLINRLVL